MVVIPPTEVSGDPEAARGVIEGLIRRVERKAELPQAGFLSCLKEYANVVDETWAEAFPQGYRTRVAPEFLAEVYSHGSTGERWARRFVEERGAVRSPACKELISVMMAVDAMVLVDREPGVINTVSLERLSRKAMGIVEAWKKVKQESDWSKQGGSKNWKSKVDYESAKRIDPSLLEEAHFRIRPLEEEVRKEVERDANLLKARSKLGKYAEGAGGEG